MLVDPRSFSLTPTLMTHTAPQPDAMELLKGEIKRVRYSNAEGTWSICELIVPERFLPVTIVGNILSVQPGESVEVEGTWVDDPKFGRQFKINTIHGVPPITEQGIERYLAGGFIDGIGRKLAARIVAVFGAQTLDVLDEDPERLAEVEGIGKVRLGRIQQAWLEQRAIRRVMVFLHGHGISSNYANKIFKLYGERAVEIILHNPYRLADDIFGIGFTKADVIARSTGLDPTSITRLRAGLLYALKRARSDGHMFLPIDELYAKALELLHIESDALGGALEDLRMNQRVVVEPLEHGGSGVYLARSHRAEVDAARHMTRLMRARMLLQARIARTHVSQVEQQMGLGLAPAQREAILAAWSHKVSVLTGGPGTGKTTIVRAIVMLGNLLDQRLCLAAPTGRAAKRLAQATGHEARTLHRLLEFSFQEGGFQRNEERPLEVDMLIVDESSMLDTSLLVATLAALPDQARVLLVGDVDQLPSVGPGNVLADLIHSGQLNVVRLTEIFRQAKDSHIVLNAHRVNAGQLPQAPARAPGELADFYTIEAPDPALAQAYILHMVCERIPKAFGYDPIQDVQILCPMHKGMVGAAALNDLLQKELNPDAKELVRSGRRWKVGDKVMQVRNDYEKEVFNGDVGLIEEIDDEDVLTVRVRFEDRLLAYEVGELDALMLAYAITVHKSQGSEYPVVVLPVTTQHFMMLQRNLLYTALTRARSLVIIVGTQKALGIAVRQEDARRRYTMLIRRLRDAGSGQRSTHVELDPTAPEEAPW